MGLRAEQQPAQQGAASGLGPLGFLLQNCRALQVAYIPHCMAVTSLGAMEEGTGATPEQTDTTTRGLQQSTAEQMNQGSQLAGPEWQRLALLLGLQLLQLGMCTTTTMFTCPVQETPLLSGEKRKSSQQLT